MKYLILVLLLVGCGPSFQGERELGQISALVRKRLVNENKLIPFGSGARWPDKCHAISYTYAANYTATIAEARRAIVSAVQVVVESAKSVKSFEKHLAEPPFTEKNVWLGIKFTSPSCEQDELIDLAVMMFETIHYEVDNSAKTAYEIIYEETYEEALQILKEEGYF